MLRACVVVVCALVVGAQLTDDREEGDFCSLRNGNSGVCRLIDDCSAVTDIFNAGKMPEICSFQDRSAIVCCPEGTNNQVMLGSRPHEQEPPLWPSPGNRPGDRPGIRPGHQPQVPTEENVVFRPESPEPVFQETSGSSGKRISEIKCKEYSSLVTQEVEALPLLPNAEPVSISVPKCDMSKLPLIVGGETTEVGEFPHMAALGYMEQGKLAWNCGGSLISDYYVVTAAHCTTRAPDMVRLGELNLKSDDDDATPQDFRVIKVIRHHQYKPPTKYNDIALLRLEKQVIFSKNIRPACLYNQDTFPVNKTVAIGWGRIDYAEKPSDVLLKVALNIIDNELCNELYQSETGRSALPQGIISDMMCAGVLEGGMDTCQGDSGGPIGITQVENRCVHYVIGITSFGKFCAAARAPGVYTRVSHYLSWMENIVWS